VLQYLGNYIQVPSFCNAPIAEAEKGARVRPNQPWGGVVTP
jgi:hypothetical protein